MVGTGGCTLYRHVRICVVGVEIRNHTVSMQGFIWDYNFVLEGKLTGDRGGGG